MQFLSIDIETTGLDIEKCDIIEFGAVAVNGNKVHHFERVLPPAKNAHWEPKALDMQAHRMDYLTNPPAELRSTKIDLAYDFLGFLVDAHMVPLRELGQAVDMPLLAGRNYEAFDMMFLGFKINSWARAIRHPHSTIIDVAHYYMQAGDTRLPKLEVCCERAKLTHTHAHTALGDAKAVATLYEMAMMTASQKGGRHE